MSLLSDMPLISPMLCVCKCKNLFVFIVCAFQKVIVSVLLSVVICEWGGCGQVCSEM